MRLVVRDKLSNLMKCCRLASLLHVQCIRPPISSCLMMCVQLCFLMISVIESVVGPGSAGCAYSQVGRGEVLPWRVTSWSYHYFSGKFPLLRSHAYQSEYPQTHNIALTAPVAKFVVSLGADGRVLDQGEVENVLAHDNTLQTLLSKELQTLKMDEERVEAPESVMDVEKPKPSGQLVVEEDVAVGHLGWSACA